MQLFLGAFDKHYHLTFLATKELFIVPKIWKMFYMKYLQCRRTHVKLNTNITNGNTNHKNTYFGQWDGGPWRQIDLEGNSCRNGNMPFFHGKM